MLKDIQINNILRRVFVLEETPERLVYIPVKGSITTVDYKRLTDIAASAKNGQSMLYVMSKTTLDNGINALKLYDDIIQVCLKDSDKSGVRMPKPDEIFVDTTQDINQVKQQPFQMLTEKAAPVAPRMKTIYRLVKDGKTYEWSGKGNANKAIKEYLMENDKETIAVEVEDI